MALVLVKESGAGLADANAYADVADGDAYHEGHLYATAWTGASAGQKAAALVMAARVIDAEFRFRGQVSVGGQALQWPRWGCPDPERQAGVWLVSNEVPAAVREANCELARELIVRDRTAPDAGEGLKYLNVGTTQTGYDPKTRPGLLSRLVQSMLGRYGVPVRAACAVVTLTRV